jgi:protoheme IX farnesyltransferase
MLRTQNRPIASGKISAQMVWIVSLLMTATGTLLLAFLSYASAILGLATLIWYLFVYTKLKRITPLAVIPGSVVGALPILIGFTAAGAPIVYPTGIFLGLFVFIWQIPHFWLLVIFYGNDYEQAGYPTLYRVFTEYQIRLWTLGWIIGAALIALAIPLFGMVSSKITIWGITTIYLILIILASILLLQKKSNLRMLFHLINLFMVLVLLMVMFERIGMF